MISAKELTSLTELLSEAARPLEQVSTTLRRSFLAPKTASSSNLAAVVEMLIKDNLLVHTHQKLIAYYVLGELNEGSARTAPLFALLVGVIVAPLPTSSQVFNYWEKNFAAQLLLGLPKEFLKKTAKDLIELLKLAPTTALQQVQTTLDDYLAEAQQMATSLGDPFRDASVPNTLYLAKPKPPSITVPPSREPQSTEVRPMSTEPCLNPKLAMPGGVAASIGTEYKLTEDDMFHGLRNFEPSFVRPTPPLLDSGDDEVTWIMPTRVVSPASSVKFSRPIWFEWDPNIGSRRNSKNTLIRDLVTLAQTQALSPDQSEFILNALRDNPKLVHQIGMTSKALPGLVENNHNIAIEILLKLVSSNQIAEYFGELVNMEMSLHSMEVVNRLTTTIELPTDFIHLYITNCIQSCHNISDKSLIRNKVINVKDLFAEVQQFCIEFSRTREAAALFRLLKQLE